MSRKSSEDYRRPLRVLRRSVNECDASIVFYKTKECLVTGPREKDFSLWNIARPSVFKLVSKKTWNNKGSNIRNVNKRSVLFSE